MRLPEHRPVSRRTATTMLIGAAGLLAAGCADRKSASPGVLRPSLAPWDDLRRTVQGEVITPDASTFEPTRQSLVFNGRKPTRQPQAIIRVASDKDVQQAVRFAKAHNLKVAVRGGGHSWVGSSVRDSGILLDLGRLNEVRIDATNRTASAQPLVRGGEFIAQLEPLGLAFPVGHCPTVPLSGFLLNGGFGWNAGTWGPACLSVSAIEMVDAAGELIVADESNNSELFWAARGAGPGFFGVVTRYHLRLHEAPKAIRSATLVFRGADAVKVGAWLASVHPQLPSQVETACLMMACPPGMPPVVGNAGDRILLVAAAAFGSTVAESDAWLAPLMNVPADLPHFAPPIESSSISRLLVDHAKCYPVGKRYGVDVAWCDTNVGDVISRLAEAQHTAPAPGSFALIALVHPPGAHLPPMPDVALSMIGPVFAGINAVWDDAKDDSACQAWVKSTHAKLESVTRGHYIGEVDLNAGPNRAERSFSPQSWKRLRSLKRKHDPENLFHSYLGQA